MISRDFRDFWDRGLYCCSACGNPLFDSEAKFAALSRHTSFRKPLRKAVAIRPDYSLSPVSTLVICGNCKASLGRLFNDGKLMGDNHPDAGLRFEIRSARLNFAEEEELLLGVA